MSIPIGQVIQVATVIAVGITFGYAVSKPSTSGEATTSKIIKCIEYREFRSGLLFGDYRCTRWADGYTYEEMIRGK